MYLSIFLGQVISVYLIVMGLALLINKAQMLSAVREFSEANASLVFYGAIVLILGLMMVFSHNIWDGTWRVIVTFLGWAATIKGATAILFPKFLRSMSGSFAKTSATSFLGLLVLALGVYLAFQVF